MPCKAKAQHMFAGHSQFKICNMSEYDFVEPMKIL